jgi:hypothetical protein
MGDAGGTGIRIPSSGRLGLSGRHQGLESFMRFVEQFWGEFDEAQVEPQELIDTKTPCSR